MNTMIFDNHNKDKNISQKTILVVDDDPGILESLQLLLEDAGYRVVTSPDGSIFRNSFNSHRPDLILLDYWLPLQNGGEITKKLKKDDYTKDIPVVIISASYNIKDIVHDVGADDFVPKPYDINDLIRKIEVHTNNHKEDVQS